MREIWGRVLAGEVKRPKSYSLRTMEILRNLAKEEAALFVKASRFYIEKDFICTYGFGSVCSPNQIFSDMFTKEEIAELRERSKNPIYKLKEQEIKLLEKKLKELKRK